MREWFSRVMYGRYGNDSINKTLFVLALAMIVLNWIFHLKFLYWVGFACLVLYYLRFFSRDTYRRAQENEQFLRLVAPLRGKAQSAKRVVENSGTYKHFKCPSCHQKLRVPKGRGKVEITCPKCSHSFVKRT